MQHKFCEAQPKVILSDDTSLQIGAASYGHPMDPPYTPYDDLPEKLRKEMQLLQHYKDRVNTQAIRVVDVAVSEWLKADRRVAASTAARSQEEQRANDRATRAAAIRKRKAEREPTREQSAGNPSSQRTPITRGNLGQPQIGRRIGSR